jgi:alanyl-tRNA synthetase/misacylated tRNA(Ala) deacylase
MAITKSKVPDIPEIRTVKVGTLPEMMEMGTLVKNTSEAGTVVLKTNLIKGKVGTRLTVTMKKD